MLIFGSVFSGVGLLDYGLHLAGIRHAWFCEWDEWRRGILRKRWPGIPVYDDVRSVGAGRPGVHGIAGGFPCKGSSTAGLRTGMDHPETVLWREMRRAICELRPRYVLVENVANILALHDGAVWGEVLGDLAALGYDVVWDCLPAGAVGAPHLRDRVFAVATHAAGEPERDADDEAHALAGGRNARQVPDVRALEPLANAHCNAVREQSEPERGRGGSTVTGRRLEAAADPGGAGREERHGALAGGPQEPGPLDHVADAEDPDSGAAQPAGRERRGEPQGAGIPLAVDWGEYRAAIERWERALGRPAGEPLLQGVVARSARRVVRSRLSALGDGVQVQVGYIAGRYILEREEGRLAA